MSTATVNSTASFIVDRDALLAALDACQRVTKTRSPKPILSCVVMESGEQGVELRATDLEQCIQVRVSQVQVESAGAIAVECALLRDVIASLTDDAVKLTHHGEKLCVRGEGSEFNLPTADPADFPPAPDMEGESFTVPAESLGEAVRRVAFAMAKEATRYTCNGALLRLGKKGLELCATESHVLSRAVVAGVKGTASAIVPGKSVEMLGKLLGEDAATVWIGKNQAGFAIGDFTLTTNLIEGNFPPYEDIVPKESDHSVTVNREELIAAVRRCAVCLSEETKGLRCEFSAKGLTLSGVSAERGDAKVFFPCKVDGKGLAIGFNHQYLLSILRAADSEEVTIRMTSANRPARVDAGKGHTMVVMPTHLA